MSIAEKLTAIAENEQKVFDAGKKAEYDAFWDNFQINGERRRYFAAFSDSWTSAMFRPKYNLNTDNGAGYMFNNFGSRETGELSLQKLLDDAGITLDFGTCSNSMFAFTGSKFTHIGQLDFSKFRNASDPNSSKDMFGSSLRLKTIEKLILPETSGAAYLRWFNNCPALENLTLEGIVYTNFSVADSPLLTHASLMNIINCLEMKNGETFTCTLGTTNLAKLTDAEKAIATQKGWTLA